MAIREKRGFVSSCSSEHIQRNKVEACEDNFVLITIGKIFLPDLELLSFFFCLFVFFLFFLFFVVKYPLIEQRKAFTEEKC